MYKCTNVQCKPTEEEEEEEMKPIFSVPTYRYRYGT